MYIDHPWTEFLEIPWYFMYLDDIPTEFPKKSMISVEIMEIPWYFMSIGAIWTEFMEEIDGEIQTKLIWHVYYYLIG